MKHNLHLLLDAVSDFKGQKLQLQCHCFQLWFAQRRSLLYNFNNILKVSLGTLRSSRFGPSCHSVTNTLTLAAVVWSGSIRVPSTHIATCQSVSTVILECFWCCVILGVVLGCFSLVSRVTWWQTDLTLAAVVWSGPSTQNLVWLPLRWLCSCNSFFFLQQSQFSVWPMVYANLANLSPSLALSRLSLALPLLTSSYLHPSNLPQMIFFNTDKPYIFRILTHILQSLWRWHSTNLHGWIFLVKKSELTLRVIDSIQVNTSNSFKVLLNLSPFALRSGRLNLLYFCNSLKKRGVFAHILHVLSFLRFFRGSWMDPKCSWIDVRLVDWQS